MLGARAPLNGDTGISGHYEGVVGEMQGNLEEFAENLRCLRGALILVVIMAGPAADPCRPCLSRGNSTVLVRSQIVAVSSARLTQNGTIEVDWRSIARGGDVTPKWL